MFEKMGFKHPAKGRERLTQLIIVNDMLGCATFFRELIMIGDGFLDLSNGLVALSTDEVKDIVFYICTS